LRCRTRESGPKVNLCPFKIGFVQAAQIRDGFHNDGNGRPHVGHVEASLMPAYFFPLPLAAFFFPVSGYRCSASFGGRPVQSTPTRDVSS
jgi:hypothetical protein